MTIYDRIKAKEFINNYPRPKKSVCEEYGKDYRAELDYYYKMEYEAMERFKDAVFTDTGWKDHPKAEKVFGWAYNDSHASGLHEVYLLLEDLAFVFLRD
jgi:hypothetical protein